MAASRGGGFPRLNKKNPGFGAWYLDLEGMVHTPSAPPGKSIGLP
jgi:hypothetical protein